MCKYWYTGCVKAKIIAMHKIKIPSSYYRDESSLSEVQGSWKSANLRGTEMETWNRLQK